MPVPTEVEFEVQPLPPQTKTDAILVPPGNFNWLPTANGGGDFDHYRFSGNVQLFEANTVVDHEDFVVDRWQKESNDTITQSPTIHLSDRLIDETI